MDEGERKEESSLPPDYVSLAQLQEKWLQKQEERKLKQKQEEEEKRERDAQAQKEKTQNQRGRVKVAGGFVRDTGVIQDKGKGTEIFTGGPGNGRENDKRREVIRGGRTRDFKRAVAVEEKAKELGGGYQCEGAEIVAGDAVRAGILSREGGGGVEEICNVSVVEVLPRNGVNMKRTDLRGGFRGNGRNRGSLRVNELEQSEMGLDLEKKVEDERGHGKNWRGRERGSNGGYWERSNRLMEFRPVGLKGNKVDSELEKKAEDEVFMVCGEISSLSVGDRNGIWGRNSKGSNKAKEDIFEGEGSNGDKMTPEIEKKVDHEVLARESAKIGKNRGVVKGFQRNENRRRDFDQERRQTIPEICTKKDRIEGEGSNGKKVALEIEKKVDHEVLAGESAKIVENRGAVKGYWKNKNRRRDFGQERRYARPEISAEEDRIEGEGSNGNKVALEIEKKMDHEVLAGETAKIGENRWVRKGYQKNANRRRDFGQERRYARPEISAEEDRIEGEGSNGNKVALEIGKKVDYGFLAGESAKVGENKGVVKGYPTNEDRRRDFGQERRYTRSEISAEEDRIEGEGSNGNKVPLEIEKKVGREVLAGESAKIGENRGVVKGYQRNEKWRRGFGRGRRYTRCEISNSRWKMNWGENGMAWVKTEVSPYGASVDHQE